MSISNMTYNERIKRCVSRGGDPTSIIADRDQSYINDIEKLNREFRQDMQAKRYDKARATLGVLCEAARKKIVGLANAT
jgi:hypothetical protein